MLKKEKKKQIKRSKITAIDDMRQGVSYMPGTIRRGWKLDWCEDRVYVLVDIVDHFVKNRSSKWRNFFCQRVVGYVRNKLRIFSMA